jgi:hypothetical protein
VSTACRRGVQLLLVYRILHTLYHVVQGGRR